MSRLFRVLKQPPKPELAFLGVMFIAALSSAIPPFAAPGRLGWALFGAVAALVVAGWCVVAAPAARRSGTVITASLFVLIISEQMATGGVGTGWAALVLLPLAWTVLFGTSAQMRWSTLGAAAVLVIPWVLSGMPAVAVDEQRSAALLLVVVAVACPVAQRRVRALRAAVERERLALGQLSSIVAAATEHAIIAADLDGNMTLFSPGAERMFGRSSAEMIGRQNYDILHGPVVAAALPTDPAHDPASFRDVVGSAPPGEADIQRWIYRRTDGSPAIVRVTATRQMDGETHIGWTFVGRDITFDEVTQHDLAAAEQRWRTMMDNLPLVTVLVVDRELQSQVLSGAGRGHLGRGSLAGLTLAGSDQPDVAAVLAPMYRSALLGDPASGEVTFPDTGTVLHVTAVPLPEIDGPASSALVVALDVTATRRREATIRAGRDFARRLFDEAPHGKLIISLDGIVTHANPALGVLIGIESADLEGRPLLDGPLDGLITERDIAEVATGSTPRLRATRTLLLEHEQETFVELTAVAIAGQDDDRVVLVSVVDISERKRFEQQLEHLAHHDALTGLANRRQFDKELESHLERCRRYGAQGAVIMIDLDHFKEINDALGHGAGDQLIISIAAILRRRMRASDVVARFGGDEFAILLPVSDRDATEAVAAHLLTLISTTVSVLDGSRPRSVTASLGAVIIQDVHRSAGELLATADMTMYDAKESGRNQYSIHDAAEHRMPRTSARIAWASKIAHALEHDRFQVHAQPILDVATDRITGAELLIRMLDADGSLIMPGKFLYIAERTDLIVDIDLYMIEQAIRTLARLRSLDPSFVISVNLSGRSVGNPRVTALIPLLAERCGVDLSRLVLEITETAAVSDIETARLFAHAMRGLGCKFALDDFGAGFGSFYYLKHLVFDDVKIDGEFIANLRDNVPDQLIVESITQIAHGLKKRVVAEFVTDAATLEIVRTMGIDKAQGFHIGRPIPIDDLLDQVLPPRRS